MLECRQQATSKAKLLWPTAQMQLEISFYMHQPVFAGNHDAQFICMHQRRTGPLAAWYTPGHLAGHDLQL